MKGGRYSDELDRGFKLGGKKHYLLGKEKTGDFATTFPGGEKVGRT